MTYQKMVGFREDCLIPLQMLLRIKKESEISKFNSIALVGFKSDRILRNFIETLMRI